MTSPLTTLSEVSYDKDISRHFIEEIISTLWLTFIFGLYEL